MWDEVRSTPIGHYMPSCTAGMSLWCYHSCQSPTCSYPLQLNLSGAVAALDLMLVLTVVWEAMY